MKREEALDFWSHEQLQTMIFSFNRFKKLQILEHKTKLSANECVPFLPSKLATLPYFYDFNSHIQRLLLLPPNVLERLALFLGCAHFIKEISVLSLQNKEHELFKALPKEVLDFAKGDGRMLLGNKRPNNKSICSHEAKAYNLELSLGLIIRVGAAYLSKINMVDDAIEACFVNELNCTWQRRLEPCINKLPLELRTFNDQQAAHYFDDLCQTAVIEDTVLKKLVMRIIERYEENLWKAFFN